MRAIDAQERTLALAISTDAVDRKRRYTLWGSTFGAVILLIMFLVWQGNGKLAEEIAKALLFLISGGFGGWGWAKRQQENKPNTP